VAGILRPGLLPSRRMAATASRCCRVTMPSPSAHRRNLCTAVRRVLLVLIDAPGWFTTSLTIVGVIARIRLPPIRDARSLSVFSYALRVFSAPSKPDQNRPTASATFSLPPAATAPARDAFLAQSIAAFCVGNPRFESRRGLPVPCSFTLIWASHTVPDAASRGRMLPCPFAALPRFSTTVASCPIVCAVSSIVTHHGHSNARTVGGCPHGGRTPGLRE